MGSYRKNRVKTALVLVVVLLAMGCAGHADDRSAKLSQPVASESSQELSGDVTIAGSETMKPIIAKLAADFSRRHPKVQFAIEENGSAEGIREFALGLSLQRRGDKSRDGHDGAGRANVLASSRTLTPEELRAFVSHHGTEPLGLPIAMDAVTFYVSAQNPTQELTLTQLESIFCAHRQGLPDVTIWGELGVNGAWHKQPIRLYGRDKSSATREFLIQTVCKGGALKEDIQEQPGTASELLAVAKDPFGIGYGGAGFRTSLVRALPLIQQPGHSAIAPSQDTVADGTYPLSRGLYLYIKKEPKKALDPALLEFLRLANSQEGQQTVARMGFFPLTNAMVAKNLEILNGGKVLAAGAGMTP